MNRFYHRLVLDPIVVEPGEILPRQDTSAYHRKRAVYAGLIKILPRFLDPSHRDAVEASLRPYRAKAAEGLLSEDDFAAMKQLFDFYHQDNRDRFEPFDAYKSLNKIAMLMAMILFVDNNIKQGLRSLSSRKNRDTLAAISEDLKRLYRDAGVALHAADCAHYALFFLVQTLFDRLFVGDDEIVTYDAHGSMSQNQEYHRMTAYLDLASRKIWEAGPQERALSYAITTGWAKGIDLETWNALNRDYYSMSEDNFFSADYGDHLEKMLPQFAYARARAARTIVAREVREDETLTVVEIGAGGGAFAVDLYMALKHAGVSLDQFHYTGIEPSAMRGVYGDHFKQRTGINPPNAWRIGEGNLETFLADPAAWLAPKGRTLLVISYAIHHCYGQSVDRWLAHPQIQEKFAGIYVLDGVAETGWAKWTNMPLDCRSPENFDNLHKTGIYRPELVWHEPETPVEGHALSRAWASLRKLHRPIPRLGSKAAFVLDLDGTVYHGREAIPGAPELMGLLRERGIPFLLLTNRSNRSRETIAGLVNGYLEPWGLTVTPEEVLTTAVSTAAYLDPGSYYCLGSPALRAALDHAGFREDHNNPDYIILGYDRDLTVDNMSKAVTLLLEDPSRRFIATNPDLIVAGPDGKKIPGNGAVVEAVAAAVGRRPEVIGKPETIMYDQALEILDMDPAQVFMVGDNLTTDIAGGLKAGLQTILTLTGVTTAEEAAAAEVKADYVVANLNVLRSML